MKLWPSTLRMRRAGSLAAASCALLPALLGVQACAPAPAPAATPATARASAAPPSVPVVRASARGAVPPSTSPQAQYEAVDLARWVPAMRTPTRIILHPRGVSFEAELAAMPRAQKADYLAQALRTMQVSAPPQVGHAVLLRYGAAEGQQLVTYVEDATAARMQRELSVGARRLFYAFHVYNYSRGPALVITSFGPAREGR